MLTITITKQNQNKTENVSELAKLKKRSTQFTNNVNPSLTF